MKKINLRKDYLIMIVPNKLKNSKHINISGITLLITSVLTIMLLISYLYFYKGYTKQISEINILNEQIQELNSMNESQKHKLEELKQTYSDLGQDIERLQGLVEQYKSVQGVN